MERVRLAVEEHCRFILREVERDLGMPKTVVWIMLTENLNDPRVCEIDSEISHGRTEKFSLLIRPGQLRSYHR